MTARTQASASLSSNDVDGVKGVLILLIVLGHNAAFSALVPGTFVFLYSFHIYGFLLLPFIFPIDPPSRQLLGDRLVRYMVPHYASLICVGTLFLFHPALRGDLLTWVRHLLVSMIVGSAMTLKQGVGFELYWFLPALLSLTVLRSVYAGLGRGGHAVVLFLSCLAWAFVGLAPSWAKAYVPFGILIAIYIFPMGVLAQCLWAHCVSNHRTLTTILAVTVWTASMFAKSRMGSFVNIGVVRVYSILEPARAIVHTLIPISFFLALLGLGSVWARVPLLRFFGRNSLIIYLSHSLFIQFVLQGVPLIVRQLPGNPSQPTLALLCFVLPVCLSSCLAAFVGRHDGLRRLVLPRSMKEWTLGTKQ
jgi:fucose 4-O-acetylase-like acetyltransferase